jgi:FMN phosphatase YigB (HAD superfamily)
MQFGERPQWLTFDCYGTLIQWDEGLIAAVMSLCIISNTDDDIIAGNVAQLGGHSDRVVTAEQAYKPSREIFVHAHHALGVQKQDVVHICASPHLDLVAALDIGFRCIWIDRDTGRKAPGFFSIAHDLPHGHDLCRHQQSSS